MVELVIIGSIPVVLGIALVLRSLRPTEPSYADFMATCSDAEYLEHVKHCKIHFYHPYLNVLAGRELERRGR